MRRVARVDRVDLSLPLSYEAQREKRVALP